MSKILLLTKRLSRLDNMSKKESIKNIGSITVEYDSKKGLKIIEDSNFDLVVSDEEIDGILSGIQILEHIRENSKKNPLFIIGTKVSKASTSLAAIEFDADDIITDKIDINDFVVRVKKTLELQYIKNEVRMAIKDGNINQAEKICIDQIKNRSKSYGWCLKKRIEILSMKKEFRALEQITKKILTKKNIEFVRVGLIEALYGQQFFQDARSYAEETTKHFPFSVKSYILMGDCYISINDVKKAMKCYEKAIVISPLSVKAKHKLANTSELNGDPYKMAKSYGILAESTINTFHQSEQDLINLSSGIVISGTNQKNFNGDIQKTYKLINSASKKNPFNKKIKVHALITDANISIAKGNAQDGLQKLGLVIKEYEKEISGDSFAMMAISSTYQRLKIENKADYFQRIAEKLSSKKIKISKTEVAYMGHIKEQRKIKEAATLNSVGIDCYKCKDYHGAVESILDALSIRPNQITYCFNLLKVILKAIEIGSHDEKMINVFEEKLNFIEQIKDHNKFNETYCQIENRWKELMPQNNRMLDLSNLSGSSSLN